MCARICAKCNYPRRDSRMGLVNCCASCRFLNELYRVDVVLWAPHHTPNPSKHGASAPMTQTRISKLRKLPSWQLDAACDSVLCRRLRNARPTKRTHFLDSPRRHCVVVGVRSRRRRISGTSGGTAAERRPKGHRSYVRTILYLALGILFDD